MGLFVHQRIIRFEAVAQIEESHHALEEFPNLKKRSRRGVGGYFRFAVPGNMTDDVTLCANLTERSL